MGLTLATAHYRATQEALLRRLRSAARSAIEESGANLLFLAFGFLQWRDAGESDRSFLAPLLLLPVELAPTRSPAGHSIFRLTATGEDLQTNHSLARRLVDVNGRDLPVARQSDEGVQEHPSSYLKRVEQTTRDLESWAVRPYLTLGLFDFGAFLLWRDLDPAVWSAHSALISRPLLRQLIGAEPARPVPIRPEPMDEHIDVELSLVDRADGSQARALVRAIAARRC